MRGLGGGGGRGGAAGTERRRCLGSAEVIAGKAAVRGVRQELWFGSGMNIIKEQGG